MGIYELKRYIVQNTSLFSGRCLNSMLQEDINQYLMGISKIQLRLSSDGFIFGFICLKVGICFAGHMLKIGT